MSNENELRRQSRAFHETAAQEPDPKLKELLDGHARALEELANRIEREERS